MENGFHVFVEQERVRLSIALIFGVPFQWFEWIRAEWDEICMDFIFELNRNALNVENCSNNVLRLCLDVWVEFSQMRYSKGTNHAIEWTHRNGILEGFHWVAKLSMTTIIYRVYYVGVLRWNQWNKTKNENTLKSVI